MKERSGSFKIARSRLLQHVFEMLKWVLIIWLLLPLKDVLNAKVDFARVLFGITLFVIFTGKLLYDTILTKFPRQRRVSQSQDVLSMLGIVVGIAFLVGLAVFFIGLFVFRYINYAMNQ